MVEGTLGNFKESLPLVLSLKNDSMKERHWVKISEVTGVTFDTTLKSLTLANIFTMELHNFATDVEEIINESAQEAKIETELAKIEAVWRNLSLGLMVYKKDGQPRGTILKPADDVKLELEDHLLNLQTISGSRFVGNFIDTVKKWEKHLISWLNVWRYGLLYRGNGLTWKVFSSGQKIFACNCQKKPRDLMALTRHLRQLYSNERTSKHCRCVYF